MGHHRHNPYLAAGLTAFAVITGALLLFFLLVHFQTVAAFLGTIAGILRPIFMGAVIAFLLVPVHRWISGLLLEAAPKNRRVRRALNFLSILLSLALAILLIYVLMCLIASRKPGGKVVLAIFLVWIATIIACATAKMRSQRRASYWISGASIWRSCT